MALIFRQIWIIKAGPKEVRQIGGDLVQFGLGLGKLSVKRGLVDSIGHQGLLGWLH
jgi:hypothetical protein